jgi:hypothetical protein
MTVHMLGDAGAPPLAACGARLGAQEVANGSFAWSHVTCPDCKLLEQPERRKPLTPSDRERLLAEVAKVEDTVLEQMRELSVTLAQAVALRGRLEYGAREVAQDGRSS